MNSNEDNTRDSWKESAVEAVLHGGLHGVEHKLVGWGGGLFTAVTHVGTLNPEEDTHKLYPVPPVTPEQIREIEKQIQAEEHNNQHLAKNSR